jgi:hypothetical protein
VDDTEEMEKEESPELVDHFMLLLMRQKEKGARIAPFSFCFSLFSAVRLLSPEF